jgi:hypothetical protein
MPPSRHERNRRFLLWLLGTMASVVTRRPATRGGVLQRGPGRSRPAWIAELVSLGAFQPKANSGVSRSLPTMISLPRPHSRRSAEPALQRARRTISTSCLWSALSVSTLSNTLAALRRATPPPGRMPSSTAAGVARQRQRNRSQSDQPQPAGGRPQKRARSRLVFETSPFQRAFDVIRQSARMCIDGAPYPVSSVATWCHDGIASLSPGRSELQRQALVAKAPTKHFVRCSSGWGRLEHCR